MIYASDSAFIFLH